MSTEFINNKTGGSPVTGARDSHPGRVGLVFLALFLAVTLVPACSSSEAASPEKPAGEETQNEEKAGAQEAEKPATPEEVMKPGSEMEGEATGSSPAGQGAEAGQGAMSGAENQAVQGAMKKPMEQEMDEPPPADTESMEIPGAKIPYEKAFPEDFKRPQPIRIGVLSSPKRPGMGERVSMILGNFQRASLEKSLGRRVRVAFVSRAQRSHGARTIIRYRPDYLKAAIKVAGILPSQELVELMSKAEQEGTGVDIMVYIGDRMR